MCALAHGNGSYKYHELPCFMAIMSLHEYTSVRANLNFRQDIHIKMLFPCLVSQSTNKFTHPHSKVHPSNCPTNSTPTHPHTAGPYRSVCPCIVRWSLDCVCTCSRQWVLQISWTSLLHGHNVVAWIYKCSSCIYEHSLSSLDYTLHLRDYAIILNHITYHYIQNKWNSLWN